MYREKFLQELSNERLQAEYESLKGILYNDAVLYDDTHEIKEKIRLVLEESSKRKITLHFPSL